MDKKTKKTNIKEIIRQINLLLKKRCYFKLNRYSVMNILGAIVINFVIRMITLKLGAPLYLDSVGTVAVSIQFGPLAGIVVSVLSSLMTFVMTGGYLSHDVFGFIIAIMIGLFIPKGRRDDMLSVVSLALLTGLMIASLRAIYDIGLWGGLPLNIWGDNVVLMLTEKGVSASAAAFMAECFLCLPDMVICLFLGQILVDTEEVRFLKKKRKKWSSIDKGITVLVLALGLTFVQAGVVRAAGLSDRETVQETQNETQKEAQNETQKETLEEAIKESEEEKENESEYESTRFGSEDGIKAAEANAVAQTDDGFIWVGTYSGLYVYDGIQFEEADIDDRIKTVMALKVDSQGRLWIGTNESGVCCYDPKTMSSVFYSTENGLEADSIRSIGEDSFGNIYIGTVLSVAKIDTQGNISTYSDIEEIYYTQSFCSIDDGAMVGVTNAGTLFVLQNDELISTMQNESDSDEKLDNADDSKYRHAVYTGSDRNTLYVGTSTNLIELFDVEGNQLRHSKTMYVEDVSFTNVIFYDKARECIFIGGEDGMGYLNINNGHFTNMATWDYQGAVSGCCVDHQGNIWFTSSKQGVIKYSETPFEDVNRRVEMLEDVVNALYKDENLLYVGTDHGLYVINLDTNKILYRDFYDKVPELFDSRIRQIYKDSKDNIWVSTYGEAGLVRFSGNGEDAEKISDKNEELKGMRFRATLELSDGRIVVAGNDGLAFLKNEKVDSLLSIENGLNNQYILTMVERPDGSILAGSDGDGIYIIKDDQVVGHIGKEEGLETSVVLRIVPCGNGYLYVTSNALYYDNGNSIKRLQHFPYSNNYDAIMTEDGNCWITSSAGIYVVSVENLLTDHDYSYTLLDKSWGLDTSFTANSWNVNDGEDMYLCCAEGVRRISINDYDVTGRDYQLQLKSIVYGDNKATKINGDWLIDAVSGRVEFNIAVNNYSLSNPLIYYKLESESGFQDEGMYAYQSDITPLTFTNLPGGQYQLHIMAVNENTGAVEKETVENITKAQMKYEKLHFKIYLYFVIFMLMFYVVWLFVSISRRTSSIRGLQKEVYTDPMTGILNKSGSERRLKAVCRDETGVLLMIDLDSFKLVNDLYGHDMGDRILIRFAELLKQGTTEEDIVGRLGGDEFVAFIKNTMDEADIEKFTKFMNKEIVKSAKAYMGEDMQIPIGTSIGAVRVPVEGTDFDSLFRFADKALYIVKQNGKHGFAFYEKKGASKETGEEQRDKNDLAKIKKIIGERNEGRGAFSVNFDKLQVIYKFLNRNDKVNSSNTGFLRFTLEMKNGDSVSDEIQELFEDYLITHLKKNDVVSVYSGSYFVLCVGIEEDGYESIANRIIEGWNSFEGEDDSIDENVLADKKNITISYEIEKVGE